MKLKIMNNVVLVNCKRTEAEVPKAPLQRSKVMLRSHTAFGNNDSTRPGPTVTLTKQYYLANYYTHLYETFRKVIYS